MSAPHAPLSALKPVGTLGARVLGAIAATGVDYVSVGRITQSAPAVDIGLDFAPA